MSLDVVWFERKGGIHLGAVRSEGAKKVTLVDERGETLRIPKVRLLGGLEARVEKGGAQAVREALRRLHRDLGEQADPPDLNLLWDALEDGRGYPLIELVQKSYPAKGDSEAIALVDALCPEGRRVERRFRITEGNLRRVDRETLGRLAEREARLAREESAGEAFLAWYSDRSPGDDTPPPEATEGLELLRGWALAADKFESAGAGKRLAQRIECTTPDELLVLLESAGLLPRDVNELLGRRGVRIAFPAAVEAAAAALLPAPPPAGEDLRDLPTIAVDDPGTTEVDDALSSWEADGARWLAVHIARPEALQPGDPIDVEAQRRATSIYFSEQTVPMLPTGLVADRWSLGEGADRAALSLVARVGETGLPEETRFTRSVVRVDRQVNYEDAGADPTAAAVLEPLLPVAKALRASRVAAGARIVTSPQLKLLITPEGPRPRKVSTDRDSHLVVSELMVFYNAQVAARLAGAGAAGIYRTQPDPVAPLKDLDPGDPLLPIRRRRGLPPTHLTVRPGPHRTMGLEAYLQATSPLRRLGDLLAQRQLQAILDGCPCPYDHEQMKTLQEKLNKLERRSRQLEEERSRYLIARWLESVDTLEGVISRAGRKPAVFLTAIDRELPLRLPRKEEPVVGTRLRVRPARIDARAREILLERAPDER